MYIYMYTYIQFLDAINHSPISPWRNLHFFQLTLEPFLRRLAPLAAASWTITGWWLGPTPLKNMCSSAGMMKFPKYMGKIWKNKSHVPNHQPDSLSKLFGFTNHLIHELSEWFLTRSAPHSQPPTGDTPPPGSGVSGKYEAMQGW